MPKFEPVLLARINKPDSASLAAYRADGGYETLQEGARRWRRTTITDAGEGRGPARPRRGRVPVRREVDVPAEEPSRADLPVRQRRRERAGDVQQPHPHGGGSAPAARRHRDRLPRDRLAHGVPLSAVRIRPQLPRARRGDQGVLRRRPARQEHPGQRLRPRRPPAPRRRGVHLRRRDGADRKPRRQAGLAADQAAVSGDRGAVPQADDRQQRRDAVLRDAHPASAASTGSNRSACRPTRTTRATWAATGRSCTASAGT